MPVYITKILFALTAFFINKAVHFFNKRGKSISQQRGATNLAKKIQTLLFLPHFFFFFLG